MKGSTMNKVADLNSFFTKGYDVTPIDSTFIQQLGGYVISEEFGRGGEGKYQDIENPIWDRDYLDLTPEFYTAQQKYVDLVNELLDKDYFKYWREVYGKFNYFKVSVNKMHPGTSMPWHWDGFDGSFIQLLFYINTPGVFAGGEFEVGKVDNVQVNSTDNHPHWAPTKGLNYIQGNVTSTGKIKPSNDQMILLNNHNPLFVHRVNTTNELRYSVIVTCGFSNNWDNNKIKEYDIEE